MIQVSAHCNFFKYLVTVKISQPHLLKFFLNSKIC